jgi:uncharacterized damage-inducible protein DinB
MTARTLLAVCGLVLLVAPLSAQSDPISGKWGRDGTTVLDLKLDSAGTVTGQVMNGRPDNMTPIKTGSFNRHAGTLKLEGEAKNTDSGAPVSFTILGNLVGDSLKVNATFGTYQGALALVRLGAVQAAPGANEELRKRFAEVSAAVTKSADMVPADKYSYRPVATVRTFGELVAHVADSYVWYCTRASGRNVEWSDAIEKGKTDKATVTQKLRESLALCTAAYGNSSSHIGGLISNLGHTNLHYGNVITYLRMMGLVPPTS